MTQKYWQQFRWKHDWQQIAPICGWDWLQRHLSDPYPEQWIEVKYDNRVIAKVGTSAKRGVLKEAMREGGDAN